MLDYILSTTLKNNKNMAKQLHETEKIMAQVNTPRKTLRTMYKLESKISKSNSANAVSIKPRGLPWISEFIIIVQVRITEVCIKVELLFQYFSDFL